MILISEPQRVQVADRDRPPVDSMALTQEGIAPLNGGETDDSPGATLEQIPGLGTDGDDNEYRLAPAESAPITSEAATDSGTTNAEDAVAMDWQPADEPLLPSDQWTSQKSTKTRQYLLVGLLGAGGIAVSAALFVAFLNWYGSSDSSSPTAQGGTETALAPDLASDSAAGEDLAPPDDAGPVTPNDSDPSEETGSEKDNEEDTAELADSMPAAADPELATALGNTDATSPTETTGDALAVPSSLAPTEETALPLDGTAENPSPDPVQAARDALPNPLKDFAAVLDYEGQPTLADVNVIPAEAPLTAEDLGMQIGARHDALPAVDWAAQSQVTIPGLIFSEDQSLDQAINLWNHVSGVPTVVDLDSLTAAGRDPKQFANMGTLMSRSVGDVAQALGDKLQLQVMPKENRYLELRASEQALAEQLPDSVSLKGLIEGPEQHEWLLAALARLLPGTEDAWTIQDSHLSYVEGQIDLMTWFRAVRLLDSWHAARSTGEQLSNYPPEGLRNRFVDAGEIPDLDKEVSVISTQARPVGQVLSQVCRQAGFHCWIDWPRLGILGLGPGTTCLVVTHQRTLRQVLLEYADRYGLVVAFIDERTLWLTSPTDYRLQARLYVLESQGRTAEQWRPVLRPLTTVSESNVHKLDIIETPDKQHILVRCCRPRLSF